MFYHISVNEVVCYLISSFFTVTYLVTYIIHSLFYLGSKFHYRLF